eukprot:EG_transcript_9471
MAVRQRRPLVVPEEAAHPLFERPIFKKFSRLDVYARPSAEVQRRSAVGGAISLAAVAVLTFLLVTEVFHYAMGTDAYHDQLAVDMGITPKVPVNFDINFPAMQCHDLNLDVLDSTGAQENSVRADLYKVPLDHRGRRAFTGTFRSVPFTHKGNPVALDPKDDPGSPSFCGKCYIEPTGKRYWVEKLGRPFRHRGGPDQDPDPDCCNSCQEVMAMYDKHGLPRPPEEEVEQCLHHLFLKNPGCNLHGTLHLQKVKGNFHFAPGQAVDGNLLGVSLGASAPHVHAFNPAAIMRFNASHEIVHLSFGDAEVRRLNRRGVVFPLDGHRFTSPAGSQTLVKYFIKVVPTTYQIGSGPVGRSYEFAVTKHSKVYAGQFLTSSIGIFFVYDFHPIKIAHKFRRPHFLHFLVKLSGLIGGLFVVTGMLDGVVLWLVALRTRYRDWAQVDEQPQ